MSIIINEAIDLRIKISAVDRNALLWFLEEVQLNIERGTLAGTIGGSLGECRFYVDELDRVVEQRDETDGELAGKAPNVLSTEDK